MSKILNLADAANRLSELSVSSLRPFSTFDFGRERDPDARSVLVLEEEAAFLVAEIREELGSNLLAFVGCTRSLTNPPAKGSEVVVAEGKSQFDILRVARSDAANYDMNTEDLICKLQEYDTAYGIDIFHAETDTIEFRLQQLPQDLRAFCEDVYQFCPDIVNQGVGSVAKLEEEIARTRSVYLWWD